MFQGPDIFVPLLFYRQNETDEAKVSLSSTMAVHSCERTMVAIGECGSPVFKFHPFLINSAEFLQYFSTNESMCVCHSRENNMAFSLIYFFTRCLYRFKFKFFHHEKDNAAHELFMSSNWTM